MTRRMKAVTVTCGGTELPVGIWDVVETAKSITFTLAEKPLGMNAVELWFDKLVCRRDNRCPHCLKDWGDSSFTVYPNRNGIPFYFTGESR